MNPWRGLKNIPHSVWILALATLINRSGTMVLPFLVIYMTRKIGVSIALAGLVLSFYGAGALVTAPFVGRLSDKFGSLKVMKVSLIATGLFLVLYSFITNFIVILGVTLLWSVISEAFRPANLSLISDETEPGQRKTAFALNRLAINLGMSIGPVIGGFLAGINFSLLFYVNGTMSVLAGIFLIVSNVETKKHVLNVKESPPKLNLEKKPVSIFKDKTFLFFMLALIPVELVFFQFLGALPLYIIQNLKIPASTFGILMAVNTVLIIIVEVPLNNAMSNWDDRKSLALGALLCAIGYGAMIFSQNILFITLTIVIWTFGEMIFFPSSASYTAILSPENRRGEYMGYFQMTFSFSLMLGPWIGALALDHLGYIILWCGAFVLGLISTLLFLFISKKTINPH
ncbi:MAG: MFS transporter [Melioribacter sp.]|nr:MFS transporter [Melioribacter sp.]